MDRLVSELTATELLAVVMLANTLCFLALLGIKSFDKEWNYGQKAIACIGLGALTVLPAYVGLQAIGAL